MQPAALPAHVGTAVIPRRTAVSFGRVAMGTAGLAGAGLAVWLLATEARNIIGTGLIDPFVWLWAAALAISALNIARLAELGPRFRRKLDRLGQATLVVGCAAAAAIALNAPGALLESFIGENAKPGIPSFYPENRLIFGALYVLAVAMFVRELLRARHPRLSG